MPADRPTTGTGRRRQGTTEPARRDDRNRALERALDDELRSIDQVRERKHQIGAAGHEPPRQAEQTGTRDH